ncbi:NADH-quinone oxidoreductase subunit C [Streptomyces sp. NPDC018711]|uniref:NADH-quinone oxidoreductase subunit C n=1 Tax=Streptomyces sp. NPDC018711 TaxID=3365052 RepID=UPI0037AE63AE
MNAYDSLPDSVTEVFGEEATAERAYDLLTVDVPPAAWITALETARDELGCTFFDWLSAVDEPGTGFRVCAHLVALGEGAPKRLLLRTTVPHDAPVLPTAVGVYAGAGWHERETHEMFGVAFEGHPHLVPLLLPENFEGHPLRKDFVLAARVAKAWPGAKEPGESHDGGGPKRRQMLPPGVPDPNEWGPLKGQLPPAPTRPTRAAAGDRPVRRTRSATEGSATQATPEPGAPVRRSRSASEGSASQTPPEPDTTTEAPASPARPPRRSRSAADGSASQAASEPVAPAAGGPVSPEPGASPETPPATARPPRRSRSAADGSASQAAPESVAPESSATEAGGQGAPEPGASTETPPATARPPRRTRSAADGSASQTAPETPDTAGPAPRAAAATPRTRSSDAPWHHARPAFDEEPPPPAAEPEARKADAAEAPAAAEPGATEAPAAEAAAPEGAPPSGSAAAEAAPDAAGGKTAEDGPAPQGDRADSDPHDPNDPAGGDPA